MATVQAGRPPPGPKRSRVSLSRQIAGLQGELHAAQQLLVQQTQENTRAKLTAEVLSVLKAMALAMQEALAHPSGGEPAEALAALQERAEALQAVVLAEAPRELLAALPAPSRVDGWRLGAQGCGPAEVIRRVIAGIRSPTLDRDEYVATMRQRIHRMALMLRQISCGDDGPRPELAELSATMTVDATAYFYQPWGPSLLPTNMETGVSCEPPAGIWQRLVRQVKPTDWMLLGSTILNKWWKATVTVLTKERTALAQEALQHPDDLELQEAIAAQLAEVNRGYMIYATTASILLATVFATSVSSAETWVQAYPHWPILTAILEQYDALSAERAAAANGMPSGASGSGNGSGGGGGVGGGAAGAV